MEALPQPSMSHVALQDALSVLRTALTAGLDGGDADTESTRTVLEAALSGVLARCVRFDDSPSTSSHDMDELHQARDTALQERDAAAEALRQTLTAARAEAEAAQHAQSAARAARVAHATEAAAAIDAAATAADCGLPHDLASVEERVGETVEEIMDLCSQWEARASAHDNNV